MQWQCYNCHISVINLQPWHAILVMFIQKFRPQFCHFQDPREAPSGQSGAAASPDVRAVPHPPQVGGEQDDGVQPVSVHRPQPPVAQGEPGPTGHPAGPPAVHDRALWLSVRGGDTLVVRWRRGAEDAAGLKHGFWQHAQRPLIPQWVVA